MPMLYRLMFHMPMSSPHRIRMFGFFVAIVACPPVSDVSRLSPLTGGKRDARGSRVIAGGNGEEPEPRSQDPVISAMCCDGENQACGRSAAYAVIDPSGH